MRLPHPKGNAEAAKEFAAEDWQVVAMFWRVAARRAEEKATAAEDKAAVAEGRVAWRGIGSDMRTTGRDAGSRQQGLIEV